MPRRGVVLMQQRAKALPERFRRRGLVSGTDLRTAGTA
jgi:hypothetical protein